MKTAIAIYFSPTGNTKKIVKQFVSKNKEIESTFIDITLKQNREKITELINFHKLQPDYWIIGAPVYSGQIPKIVSEVFKNLDGKNIATIGIVTYGNKSFGISLKQLNTILSNQNFSTIALGAFIGEHSYSEKFNVARNRPNNLDLDESKEFGKTVFASDPYKVNKYRITGKIDLIPKLMPKDGPKPYVSLSKCNHCNVCVKNCPVSALDESTKMFLNKEKEKECLSCMSCVKKCRSNARFYEIPAFIEYMLDRCYFKNAKKEYKVPSLYFGDSSVGIDH